MLDQEDIIQNMKSIVILTFFVLLKVTECGPLDDISSRLLSGIHNPQYSTHTSDTRQTMDCLKISQTQDPSHRQFGIFHTGNQQTHYSELFYAEFQTESGKWVNTVRLSERGSQGYVTRVRVEGVDYGYLVGYQLENSSGNKIALRYYQSQDKIKANNFLYEYQLLQIVSSKQMKNIGTVSIQQIYLLKAQSDPKFNEYQIHIKFHYCPDGQHDFPGYGVVNLKPLRDFVDGKGNWKGGCYENYRDWQGLEDTTPGAALRIAGCSGKIGQRDFFYLAGQKYYLYECNLNPSFDWSSWRIALYSPTLKQAKLLPLLLGGDIDIANPHITLLNRNGNTYNFVLTFFLPGEGIKPDIEAKGGECIVYSSFGYP